MVNDVTLGAALRANLHSLSRSQDTIDEITERLATGRDVNSAIDDPQNFFTARTFRNRASDNARLLDGIGQSIRTVQESIHGIEALSHLLDQAEAVVDTSIEALNSGESDPAVFARTINASPQPISRQILQDNPDVYYRLNETAGPIIDYGSSPAGPVAATYTSGASAGGAPLYTNGSAASVSFDGVNDHISVADSSAINVGTFPARTVELVFNADTVAGRQVLYEEGAGVNGLTIYIDNGLLYVSGEDDQGAERWIDANINAPIVAGQTYHAAFVFDGANTDFIGYLDGVEMGRVDTNGATTFPSHTGDIHIGGGNDAAQFHDGEANANAFSFAGRISDVAIYNRALTEAELFSHADSLEALTSLQYQNRNYNAILDEIDQIVIDANYRGINLLNGDTLRTDFNPDSTSFLETEGQDFSVLGLGLQRSDFLVESDLQSILDKIDSARERVRRFGTTLATELSVIQIRDTFTREIINTNLRGSDDLTVADQNEQGANLLATQTRLALGVVSLGLAAQSQSSVVGLIGR